MMNYFSGTNRQLRQPSLITFDADGLRRHLKAEATIQRLSSTYASDGAFSASTALLFSLTCVHYSSIPVFQCMIPAVLSEFNT
jgi:hypothetical protein